MYKRQVIAGNFIAFSVASLINLPGNALGSASTIITGKRLGKGQIGQAEFQAWHVFWLSTIILTLIAWGSAPFAGFIASFYTHEEDVKAVSYTHLVNRHHYEWQLMEDGALVK